MNLFGHYLKSTFISPSIEQQFDKITMPNVSESGWDPWGYNKDLALNCMPLIKWFYEDYFRVEVLGVDNVPAQGRVMLIANHAGQLPFDGVMVSAAMLLREKDPRAIRAMIARFFPTVPYVGSLMNACGAVIGDPMNCSAMLDNDEAVLVFPEGTRGSGKLYKDRYTLQRMGNGFVRLAVIHNTPIIPIGVVGSEETMPAVKNLSGLAKALGLPYFPLGPLLPLPARISIRFGEPMLFDGDPDDNALMFKHVERVRTEIESLINDGLAARTSIF
jgi:1-acyl-sn-glycerol-3-phosphate acyltransferase